MLSHPMSIRSLRVTQLGARLFDDAKCNNCHQELGTFTEDAFHAGQRNDGTSCSWCHTPNRASSGWSADSASFVHSIHAGAEADEQIHLACSLCNRRFLGCEVSRHIKSAPLATCQEPMTTAQQLLPVLWANVNTVRL